MMNTIMHRVCMFVMAVGMTVPCLAKGAGTESAEFMKLSAGARAVGMGEAYCAVADDVDGVRHNPGGITQVRRGELLVTHNEWMEGIQSEFAGIIYPMNKTTAFAGTVQYAHTGGIVRRDITGAEMGGTFGYQGIVATVCMARKVGALSAGVSLKAIQESLNNLSDTGYACDIGVLYSWRKINAGFMAGNFGQGIKLGEDRFSLPEVAAAGVSYRPVDRMLISMDVDRWLHSELTELRVGSEYTFKEFLALRAGYQTGRDATVGPGVSVGVGFRYESYRMDYGFMPMGDLGSAHRISFAVSFGNNGDETRNQEFAPIDWKTGQR